MQKSKRCTGISFFLFSIFLSFSLLTMPVFAATPSSKSSPFSTSKIALYYEQAYRYNVFNDKNKPYFKDYRRRCGTYPTRKGVILVTQDSYKNLLPTGHSAIIYSKNYVVEATSKGVVKGKNNWNQVRRTCFGVTVKATTKTQDAKAADWCYKQKSKPYNYNYLNVSTRKKFYCAQLIWAAFKDLYKIDLNMYYFGKAIHPVELINTSKTKIIYRK